MWEWLYYNFAARSLHTKKLCSRFYSIEVDFCSKKTINWLDIRHNWTFFRYLLWLRCYKRKSVELGVQRGGWVTFCTAFRGKGRRPPTAVGGRKPEGLLFHVVSKYLQSIIYFCHNTRVSDGQMNEWMDGQTELWQQHHALHYMLHSKNCPKQFRPKTVEQLHCSRN